MRTKSVNLYEAKTHLSTLVDEAAGGATIVIAKNGEPRAMLVPLATKATRGRKPRKPAHVLKVTYIADDFDAVDDAVVAAFEGR